jgi:hypothetical protein
MEQSKKPELNKPEQQPKQRHRFIITVEGLVPATINFQTFAEDENEALKQLDNPRSLSLLDRPQLDLPRLRRRKVIVKDANTSLVKIVKNY